MDENKILETAQEAALKAGKYLRDSFDDRPDVQYKGEIDLVTERDLNSQKIIFDIIQERFPDHSVLGEENLDIDRGNRYLWIIDPLDGTTNYAHAIPMYSVSIAFRAEGETRAGVVYIPMLDELFYGVKGGGAFLNKKKLSVSKEQDPAKCLLATGFPYDRKVSKENNLDHFAHMIMKVRCIRRMGSAAVDLCYTAAGRFDAFWEPKLHPWDTAAAALLVSEAGGKVTDYSGNPFNPFMKECLASNNLVHDQMMEILSREKTKTS